MIQEVSEKTKVLQQTSLKRKNEEEKLNKERAAIESRKKEIEQLNKILEQKRTRLRETELDVKRHKIFETFLQSVVEDRRGDRESFMDILDLQDRFKTLKLENVKLMDS